MLDSSVFDIEREISEEEACNKDLGQSQQLRLFLMNSKPKK